MPAIMKNMQTSFSNGTECTQITPDILM